MLNESASSQDIAVLNLFANHSLMLVATLMGRPVGRPPMRKAVYLPQRAAYRRFRVRLGIRAGLGHHFTARKLDQAGFGLLFSVILGIRACGGQKLLFGPGFCASDLCVGQSRA